MGTATGPFLARRQDSGVVCLWARARLVVASGRQVQGYSYGVCNEQQQEAMNSSLHDGQAATSKRRRPLFLHPVCPSRGPRCRCCRWSVFVFKHLLMCVACCAVRLIVFWFGS